ncbi:4Fe-4S dicluster domain-containing protein [Pseudodesulfovibrio piezophilus]|uniref:4Fe-4S ferredoxin iron-sulfur binding domain protein n=1 Tax=Pseudodesulfovibrio piezophilus (strain DSM 21447 / JCM 15486 / C1TLV30) TaxID=1322246 RepID=M1WSK6_PSEP2|nr:4Fe-4S dicluster domain-containing protein [Pseudodesulfovibrio piezophilus]CCH50249.1 4Fe-4S ferredoxin iron-sulfur binding domain protein [Pseudodesulfovibrio piezophilus C1TLV30]
MQTRRTFIKNGLVLIAGSSGLVSYTASASGDGPHYGMIILKERCMGCNSCASACKLQNGTAQGHFLTHIEQEEVGEFPDAKMTFTPDGCRHCAEPFCLDSCEVNAIHKLANGIVVTDWGTCTGDGACVDACPFNARFVDPVEQKADSCDFCLSLLSKGSLPACVTSCPASARLFGDIKNPEGEFAKALRIARLSSDFTTTNMNYLDKQDGRIQS